MRIVDAPPTPLYMRGPPYDVAPAVVVDPSDGPSVTVYTVIDCERFVVLTTPHETLARHVAESLNENSIQCGQDIRSPVYRDAIARWGEAAQVHMLHEEIGELLAAVGHFYRGRATRAEVISEVADVRVMLEQLVILIGSTEAEVHQQVRAKVRRLADRLRPATTVPKE